MEHEKELNTKEYIKEYRNKEQKIYNTEKGQK